MRDAIDEIVIYPRRTKLVWMMLGCLGFVLAMAWMSTQVADATGLQRVKIWAAEVIGVPFFGLGFLFALYRLFVPRPAIRATPDGLEVGGTALSPGMIRWNEIERLVICEVRGQKMMGVALVDPPAVLAREGFAVRWLANINASMTGCPFHVPQSLLSISSDDLIRKLRTYRARVDDGL